MAPTPDTAERVRARRRRRAVQPAAASADELLLHPTERLVLEQVRLHGTAGFVTRVTLVIVSVSLIVSSLAILPIGGFEDPVYWVPAVVLSTLIPALSAPPALAYTVRLVAQLDVASALLHQAAVTDALTGVRNRRGFFDALPQLAEGAEVDVAMVDLDFFKQLNDRHGHDFGDRALRAVAAWLQSVVGDHGVVGRLGGDEFAFVARAGAVADIGHRQRIELEGIELELTIGRVRAGVADDREMALIAADGELYRFKRSRSDSGISVEPAAAEIVDSGGDRQRSATRSRSARS